MSTPPPLEWLWEEGGIRRVPLELSMAIAFFVSTMAMGKPVTPCGNLSSPHPKIQSNKATFQATYKPTNAKKVGSFILQP